MNNTQQTKPYLSMSLEELQAELIKWQDIYKLADLNQYTLKILMNSSYGSLSLLTNPFSAYGVLGSSITSTGRFYNRYVAYRINVFINSVLNKYSDEELFNCPYTIQSDTDSSYNLLEGLCDLYLPNGTIIERLEFAQKYYEDSILPVIEAAINEVSYTLNVYNPKVMKMDQEVLASSFISVAPKRYYLRNHFKEIEGKVVLSSIEKAKIKITGLSVVGKSTPGWSKKHLKPVMNLILDDTEKNVSKYINDCKDSIYSAELISVCTFKKVSKVSFDDFYNNKFYRYSDNNNLTTVGGHGKGALWYNKYMFEKQLTHLYPLIQPGDTVKVLPLLKDNPLVQSDTIAFIDMKFITEQGFYKYIDYEVLFEKIFIKNVEIILKPLGWEVFNTYEDLESLWGDIDL